MIIGLLIYIQVGNASTTIGVIILLNFSRILLYLTSNNYAEYKIDVMILCRLNRVILLFFIDDNSIAWYSTAFSSLSYNKPKQYNLQIVNRTSGRLVALLPTLLSKCSSYIAYPSSILLLTLIISLYMHTNSRNFTLTYIPLSSLTTLRKIE